MAARYDDDDGRTIADMSGVEGPGMFLPRRSRKAVPEPPGPEREGEPERFWEQQKDEISPEDRRMYVFAALKAALLIGGVFLLGAFLLIVGMLALWR